MLNFKNISKNYKTIKALKDITFSIPENSIFGILGANGSGKSTFMKILPGLIYDWSGEIYYEDRLLTKNDMILRHDFGYLIESPTFYEYLSARKNLEILARVSNVNINRIDYVLDLVELSNRSLDKVSAYSYGMKQRLGIAQALLHDPKILVLDEPNNGLDPNGINDMIRLIKNLKSEGKTICLSTHNLKDVEELCTDFTVFKDGLCSNSASLSDQFIKSRRWVLSVKNPTLAISQIKQSDSFEYINSFNDNILIESKTNDTINSMNALLQDNEIYKISKESNLIEYF
ncbi:MAG: ABC transporter ATP-binding protein [Candidatus Neomarinimicrobiota bacterium]